MINKIPYDKGRLWVENAEKMIMLKKDKIPKFDGNIVLMFPKSVTGSQITLYCAHEALFQF